MWGYLWTPAAAPSLEIIGYTADRPSCEYSRLRSETRGGVPVPSQLSAPCQQLDVLPHREGAAPVYWVCSSARPVRTVSRPAGMIPRLCEPSSRGAEGAATGLQ